MLNDSDSKHDVEFSDGVIEKVLPKCVSDCVSDIKKKVEISSGMSEVLPDECALKYDWGGFLWLQ